LDIHNLERVYITVANINDFSITVVDKPITDRLDDKKSVGLILGRFDKSESTLFIEI